MFFFTRGDHYVGRFIDSGCGPEFLRMKAGSWDGCGGVCVGGGGIKGGRGDGGKVEGCDKIS